MSAAAIKPNGQLPSPEKIMEAGLPLKASKLLTQRESDLLLLLVKNKGNILKREFILENIWGKNDFFLGRSMDVFISRVRKHLKKDPTVVIENVHGVGFRLIF